MTTIFLPNAYLTDDMQLLTKPDWTGLDLYYRLREMFLGEQLPVAMEAAANQPFPEKR